MYIHPIKIGNVEIKNNIFLAPMAGISDMPFRILCKEKGAGLVYTEMVSSKGMFYDDTNTFKWCIATPKTKNKKLANSTDSVLFKMRKNGKNDIAELVPDIATMKKVFDAYNKFVDEING